MFMITAFFASCMFANDVDLRKCMATNSNTDNRYIVDVASVVTDNRNPGNVYIDISFRKPQGHFYTASLDPNDAKKYKYNREIDNLAGEAHYLTVKIPVSEIKNIVSESEEKSHTSNLQETRMVTKNLIGNFRNDMRNSKNCSAIRVKAQIIDGNAVILVRNALGLSKPKTSNEAQYKPSKNAVLNAVVEENTIRIEYDLGTGKIWLSYKTCINRDGSPTCMLVKDKMSVEKFKSGLISNISAGMQSYAYSHIYEVTSRDVQLYPDLKEGRKYRSTFQLIENKSYDDKGNVSSEIWNKILFPGTLGTYSKN